MNLVISDVRLQAPGDIGSDLLLSAELATEIVSVFDPTGIADAIGGTIKLSQGDHTGAALSYASILVPFGADKIAKSVARVPTSAVEATVKAGQQLGENTLKTVAKSTDNIAEATAKRADTTSKVASGLGKDILPATNIRDIVKGEKVDDLLNELQVLTYLSGQEHAIITGVDGTRRIIRGGADGIEFASDTRRMIIHTHPTPTPPSDDDFKMLNKLWHQSSYVYNMFGGGGLTKFFRKD